MHQQNKMYIRQHVACPYEKVRHITALVVGCGAIGRQLARQISLLGISEITLVDPDIIEEHNCVPQMFPPSAIGQKKVDFLAQEIQALCPSIKVTAAPVNWNPKVGQQFDVVFPSVDNIDVRGALFDYYKGRCSGFFDIRIGGDSGTIFNVIGTEEEKGWYAKTLFKKSEAMRLGCAQPMTNFIANITSGLSIQFFSNWIASRGDVPKMLTYCGLDGTLVASEEGDFV